MILAKAKARANETFIVQVSLTIVTYDHQNIFIVQATGLTQNITLSWKVLRRVNYEH